MDIRYYNKFIERLLSENKDLKEENASLTKELAVLKAKYASQTAGTDVSFDDEVAAEILGARENPQDVSEEEI